MNFFNLPKLPPLFSFLLLPILHSALSLSLSQKTLFPPAAAPLPPPLFRFSPSLSTPHRRRLPAETECEIDVDDEIHACPYKRSIVNNHRRSEYDLTGSQRQRKQNRIQTQIKIRDLNGSPRAETRKGTSSSTMQLSSLHWEWPFLL
ncbi:hypothetical protein D8674_019959 [Pyrus ussuriensis x Pyrus communis]|uniref:Uncharacterized protein n=1 Tax=Pyrus ussuriensis x Pyrus communis TaxID=2448454 RepID=A0A5N5G9Q1_9ROSA|nr:hypothetical protein D8674_019959 [Pyrus ussuriensis x Pyrus communis]